MRLVQRGMAIALLSAGCDQYAAAPVQPSAERRVQGTYTLTGNLSPSCGASRPFTLRADITQSGRDLEVQLWQTDGSKLCQASQYISCLTSFFGQDNPDGVLFFPKKDDTLFDWGPMVKYGTGSRVPGTGHARGSYTDGRIDALFDGEVYFYYGPNCSAPDHPLTFVRR